MKRKSAKVKIAIIQNFALKAAKEITRGVLRYAYEQNGWEVQMVGIHMPNNDCLYPEDWTMDGAICGLGNDTPEVTEKILRQKPKGIVYTGVDPIHTLAEFPSARYVGNDREIGETAARLFLKRKLRHFAYIGSRRGEFWSQNRGKAFAGLLKAKGLDVSMYVQPSSEANERTAISNWLKSLPKPCGVFVAFDQRARLVINICHELGIRIPEQLQIVGVDDESWLCELTHPTLSSIAIDFESAGFAAAKTLDAILNHRRHRKHNEFQVKEVVERMSTADLHGHGHRAARALELIRSRLNTPLTVSGLALELGCSTRMLETSFLSVYGRTIRDELTSLRLNALKEYLANTDQRLTDLPRLVGFKTVNHLIKFFRQHTGFTPLQYRKNRHAAQAIPRQDGPAA